MTKSKLDIIKLNAIAAILALICISCATNPIDTKVNDHTNSKEDTGNFENESGNFASENQEERKDVIAKLKEFGNKLKTQKNEEDSGMAKNLKNPNLADALEIYPASYGKNEETKENFEKATSTKFTLLSEKVQETQKLQIERIIQASLNYKKEEIDKLKEILEKLKDSESNKDIIRIFLYHTTLSIQEQLDNYLQIIDKELNTLSLKNLKNLLIHAEFDLMLKEKFKKTLAKTVDEISKTIKKEGAENNYTNYIIGHITETYKVFDYSVKGAQFKQKNYNQIKNKPI
ncbi:complement regulator-acquiring protein [Borreliella lanei]|uniref:Molybdopterin converting factor small subunit n=1 Tax=Borreliella lanei TaxID=373540 RepID=A0A7W9ZBW2_9SPIR|nr:complement regulator-acquiring protein [Borreliella lanei]MBB6208525.1 molybdopterin converting factor small subunit [Borreliella lanei]MBB6208534.1 molybdopterin converting factor small subunit [Borreliella lanei]WKC85862.1 complement regulator-acquiring protein [Borreliella lanei]